ncbi:MAG: xylanase, partial [Verrucomicrobiales bacterium]|nr:xylanase [Verrucomicrobiales bacterium]
MSRLRPILLFAFSLLAIPATTSAADPARPPVREPDRIIHPWQEGDWKGNLPSGWTTPGPEIQAPTDHMGGIITIKNVSDPILAYFAPAPASASAAKGLIICPGGGYNILAWDHEGTEVATFLSARGYHAWVLKYRLPRPGNLDTVRHLPALQDAQRSISFIRSQAETFKLD